MTPELEERLVAAAESIATSLSVIAGVVDEIYKEQAAEEAERTRTVSAREVTKVSSAPAPPRVPRARAQL